MDGSLRQTAGLTTRLTVRYVRAQAGDEGVLEMLRLAGETRTPAELEDERRWSTFEQKISLWEGAAAVLGDRHASRHIGESAVKEKGGAALKLMLRALGSPRQVLRRIAQTAPKFSTVCTMTAPDVGRTSAVVTYRLHDGFEPSRHDCEYNVGLLSQVPVLFGLPPATVLHDRCQVDGAPECVYRVRWQSRSRLPTRRSRREIEHLRDQLATVVERTESLQSTIADLASPADVDSVLARIAARAGAAVGAQRHLLAVRPTEGSPPRVHADGFLPEEAEQLAADLLTGEANESDESMLVVDVISARRRYGRLAAFYSSGLPFFPEERALLAAYARHAAVALDAATALEETQERERTAMVLLELAHALAATTTPQEMAARLAKAVPSVVDADRAAVMVYDAESDALRMVGWFGYQPELGGALDSLVIRRRASPEITRFFRNPEPGYYTPDSEDGFVRSLLARYGSAGIFVVPIIARGDLLGVITADHLPGKLPLEVTDSIRARMAGLADQAATAFENSRLLAREREAVATLQEADRLKSEFLAIVSHELRTPLAVIVGGAKTLRSQGHRLEKDEHEQLLDAVIRRSEQLRSLVEDLLQTTRDFKLQLARVDLSQLAADAVRDLCSAEPEATVSCHLPGPLPVVADPSRIRQVMDNLLTNAIKYAPGSPIELRAASVDGSAEVSVSDGGAGMTKEQAAKAFEPFYQGTKDPERWTGGVGLGLYIARRIVEAHGGAIRIESSPGEGTTVHLSLPTADVPRVAEPTAPAAEKPSRTAARS